jgi:hypothetical protein
MTRRLALGGKQLAAATTLNPFTQLPPELSFHIISFLSYQDTLRLTQVRKLFKFLFFSVEYSIKNEECETCRMF